MSDGFAASYAKAVDDLSGKIFIPGIITSLMVEYGPYYQTSNNAGLFETYLFCLFSGVILSGLIFFIMWKIDEYLMGGENIAPFIAIAIMPLGFAGMFPDQFENFTVPYSRVTGVAILAWSFMLLSIGKKNEST